MNSKNASQYLMELAQQNPQFRQIMQMAQNGQNMQYVYEQLARMRGADPNYIIDKLMG